MRAWPALVLLALVACGPASEDSAERRHVISIAGPDAFTHKLLPALAASYRQNRPHIHVEVQTATEDASFKALLDNEVDIAASARQPLHAEEEQAREYGYRLNHRESRHIVGVNVVTLAVHPSNPTESLTYDQVIGIFCTRSIDNWSFLGLENQPIRVIARDPRSGTRALFEDFFCGPRGIHPRAEVLDVDEIAVALRDDPSAISFVSLSESAGKMLALRPDAYGPPIRPTQQNIIRGAYPLYHDLYLFTRGTPRAETRTFIDWISSSVGQDVVDEQRFVPLFLRPERLDEARPLRETIHFELGQSTPNQRSSARLQLLVDELQARAGEYRHIVLEGFTDPTEPNEMELARARAETVQILLQGELPGSYFEIIPRGARNPIAPNDTPYGRQRNRRVQIYLAAEEADPEPITIGEP